jgi:hypothetical protein
LFFAPVLDLLECCKISISLESDLFDNFEDTASEAEMSDFDLNDLQQIDAIITDTTDSSEHEFRNCFFRFYNTVVFKNLQLFLAFFLHGQLQPLTLLL